MPHLAPPSPQGLSDLAWLTLLHAAWLGLLAGSLASLTAALARSASPRSRHGAIVGLLAAVAIATPAAAVLQRSWVRRAIIPASVRATVEPLPGDSTRTGAATPPAATIPGTATSVGRGWGLGRATAAVGSALEAARPYLLAGWAAGASTFLAAMAVGRHALRRVVLDSTPCPAQARRARALGRMLRLARTPGVLQNPGLVEPCLAGVLRPVVLLPSRWLAAAAADEVDAVLAHELAHARRLDHLTNLFLRAIESAFWFHPGVRLASRLARREAERAADALAVRLTGDPPALARALDSVARSRPSPRRPFRPGLAVGGDRSALLPRIQELLGMKPPRPRFPYRVVPSLAVAAAIAWVAMSTSPAQEPLASTVVSAAPSAPPLGVSPIVPPDDPAQAEWLAKVQAVRSRMDVLESEENAMGVLLRLVPGNPRLPQIDQDDPRSRPELAPGDLPEDVIIRLASKRPWRLAHEDLVTLVRTIPHGPGDAAKMTREELLRIADPNQVSFEVRFFQLRYDPTSPQAASRQEESKPAHVVPAFALNHLIAASQDQFPKAILQAPKVTTFEGAGATISMTDETAPVPGLSDASGADLGRGAEVRLIARTGGPAPGAEDRMLLTDRLHGRLEVTLTAIRKSWGHAVEARLRASVPGDPNDPADAPKAVDRLARFNVWEGDSLVVDAGIDVYAADVAPPGPHVRTLVAVTPRHIPTEQEEEALNGPVADFGTTPTAAR